MDTGYLVLFGMGLGIMSFLLWMLFPIGDRVRKSKKDEIRGSCPICGHPLRKGERIRSNITEIGNVEVRTFIKGCPFCLDSGKMKRSCPVCKKKLPKDQAIMAVSDPRVDRKKLSIRGCPSCYPQGFE